MKRTDLKKLGLLLILGTAAASGCTGMGSAGDDVSTTALHLSMGVMDTSDVKSIHFQVTPVDCHTGASIGSDIVVVRDLEDLTLPGGIGTLDGHPLDPNSAHFFADLFMTLAAGCYNVAAMPIDASGAPSRICAAALKKGVVIREAQTTEISLINQCKGKDPGDLDAIVALNFAPVIKSIDFANSKFVSCNKDEVICATAVDPDGDPLDFAWTVAPEVASKVTKPIVKSTTTDAKTGAVTQCVSFSASASGKFPIDLKVYDQLWKDGKLMRIEDFLAAEGYPNDSHATNDFFFYAECPCTADVVVLPDLSGSMSDDLPIIKADAGPLFDGIVAHAPDAHFGVAAFIDKPINPMGGPGDYVFRIPTGGPLTGERTTFVNTVQGLSLGSGADQAEAQLEALMHIGTHAGVLGYRPDTQKVVVLMSDDPYHNAGDCIATMACTRANDGNATIDPLEDYPSLPQVAMALIAAQVAPIFVVTADHIMLYQQLLDALTKLGVKPGKVVLLESDNSKLITAALEVLQCPAH